MYLEYHFSNKITFYACLQPGRSYIKSSDDLTGEHTDTQNMLRQIVSIVEIIDRDHMKVTRNTYPRSA